jgi:hypothetical protein
VEIILGNHSSAMPLSGRKYIMKFCNCVATPLNSERLQPNYNIEVISDDAIIIFMLID